MAGKPKILTQLRIDEISSVDKAANEGARILLRKRDNDSAIIDGVTEELAEYVSSILASKNIDKAAALASCFNSCANYLKANLVTPLRKADELRDDADKKRANPDDKVEPKLRAWARLMVVIDPSKSEEDHLYDLINSAQGRSRAEHLNNLSKKGQPMDRIAEMAEMRKFVKAGGMASINKRIIETGATSLNEMEYTTLVQEAASLSKVSFEKAFTDPTTQQAYAVVREAGHLRALGYGKAAAPQRVEPLPGAGLTYDQLLEMRKAAPPLMAFEVRTTEVGSSSTENDDERAIEQQRALAEEMRRLAPYLTIEQAYRLAGIARQQFASAATRKQDADDPETAYNELMAEAGVLAKRLGITEAQAFAKLYAQKPELARLASRAVVLERRAV
jgi:hypothetical protein